jgi:hypothetical protein
LKKWLKLIWPRGAAPVPALHAWAADDGRAGPDNQVAGTTPQSTRPNTSTALSPPNANEFDIAYRTGKSRPTLAT